MNRPCIDCGRPVRPRDRDRCGPCHRRANPTRACRECGQVRELVANGLCDPCYHRDPDLPFRQAERLANRLGNDAPEWLTDFVAYAAGRHCVGRTSLMVSHLGRLLREVGPSHSPQVLLERCCRPGRSVGTLARTLEDFLVEARLAFPVDHDAVRAARRRQRRVAEVPEPLRPVVSRYANALVAGQDRARRAGNRPRRDLTTIEDLAIVRDLARFMVAMRAKSDWASANIEDLEAFLGEKPLSRSRRCGVLRQFFRWAKANRVVLANPAVGLSKGGPKGFHGQTLSLAEQRRLFRRWTTSPDAHPHERLVGLLALLHAASSAQIRRLKVADVDSARRTIRLGGRRHPVPLEPASWNAVKACLEHRDNLATHNRHVVVTAITRTRQTPASDQYMVRVLDPAQIGTRVLRATRLVDLVASLDPKLVCEAVGMNPAGVLPYAADQVQDARLVNL